MSEWTWVLKAQNGTPLSDVKNLEAHGQLMSGRWLTVDIESASPLAITAGCYIDYGSYRYSVRSTADVEKAARTNSYGGAFIYKDLRLEDVCWQQLNDTQFCDYVYSDNFLHYSGLGTFSFYCSLASEFAYRILANLQYKYGTGVWEVQINGYTLPTSGTFNPNYDYTFDEAKSIGISSGTSIKDALDMLWSNWGVYYIVDDYTIDIITSTPSTSVELSYGKGNGLTSVRRKINPNVEICTRVRAYGSERNMPYHWYNNRYGVNAAMYIPQLMLPREGYAVNGRFVDDNGNLYTSSTGTLTTIWNPANAHDVVLSAPHDILSKYGQRDKEVHWNSDDMGEIFPSLKGMTATEAQVTSETYQSGGRLDKVLVNSETSGSAAITYDDADHNEFASNDTGSTDADTLTSSRVNFRIRVPNPGFNPIEQKAEEDVVLLMQSGKCQARGFSILSSTPETDANENVVAYWLVCARSIDDEIDQVFPNYNYMINQGDEYVYTGLSFIATETPPVWLDKYISAAENRLLRAAAIWLREHETEDYIYEISPDNIYVNNNSTLLTEGYSVKLINDFETTTQVIDTVVVKYGKDAIPIYEVTFLKRDESESLGDRVKGLVGQTIGVDSDIAKMNDTLYKKVNKSGFKTIFTLLKSDLTTELDINGDLSELAYIRANHNFFSTGSVSALGANSGGGGGGGELFALLNSINTSSIGNVNPADNPQATGKCLVWNGSAWVWGTTGGGSGDLGGLLTAMNSLAVPSDSGNYVLKVQSGSVTLTSETTGGGLTLAQMWASLTNSSSDDYSSTKVNAAHIPYLSSLYYDSSTTLANKLSNYLLTADGVSFTDYTSYIRPVFADSDLAAAAADGWVEWWDSTNKWYNHAMGHVILTDGSNQIWANTSGTVKFSLPSSSGTLALTSQLLTSVTPTTYSSGYVVTHGTLYSTSDGMQLQLNRRSITSIIQGEGCTWWGASMDNNGVVKGDMSNVGNIRFSGSNFRYISNDGIPKFNSGATWGVYNEYNTTWPLYITSGNNVGIGTNSPSYKLDVNGNIRTTSELLMTATNPVIRMGSQNILDYNSNNSTLVLGYGIRSTGETYIEGGTVYLMASGGGTACARTGTATVNNSTGYGLWCENFMGVLNKFMFYYESGTNTVWVTDENGDAVNFASKGGVSALGLTGGSSSATVGTLNVSTLKVTSSMTTWGTLNVGNSSNRISMDENDYYLYLDSDNGIRVGTDLDMNTLNLTNVGQVQFSSTRYLYIYNGHLYFKNGSSNTQIA